MATYLNQGITPSDLVDCESFLQEKDGDTSCLLFRFNHEINLWEAYQIVEAFSVRSEGGEWG